MAEKKKKPKLEMARGAKNRRGSRRRVSATPFQSHVCTTMHDGIVCCESKSLNGIGRHVFRISKSVVPRSFSSVCDRQNGAKF